VKWQHLGLTRSDPPMPRLMTSVMAWPVKPFHSPLRTDSVKPLIWCRTRLTSGITYQHQTQSITVKYVHIRHHLPIPGITYQHQTHSSTMKYVHIRHHLPTPATQHHNWIIDIKKTIFTVIQLLTWRSRQHIWNSIEFLWNKILELRKSFLENYHF